MAAAFWSQGGKISPEDLNPLRQSPGASDGGTVEMPTGSGEPTIVKASSIRVQQE